MFLLLAAESGDRIAGFLFEPIQGEAGVCVLWNWIFDRFNPKKKIINNIWSLSVWDMLQGLDYIGCCTLVYLF